MPAAAIVGAGVLTAGASIVAGNKAAKVQKNAAEANAELQREQNDEARRQYDLSREDLRPYREAGYTTLAQLLKGSEAGGEFNRNFTMSDFNKDPGYQFRFNEGLRGLDASASARGGVLSGGALKALARYKGDFDSNEYGAAYNRWNNDTTTRFNRLASIAGVGQTATNTGIQSGQQFVNTLQNGVNNLTAANDAAANARSSAYVNTGNAIGGAVGSIGQYYALKSLLNPSRGGLQTLSYDPNIFDTSMSISGGR